MKVQMRIVAAYLAIKDRRIVCRGIKNNMDKVEINYYNALKKVSGPSVHKPKRIVKSWFRAYKENLERMEFVKNSERQFSQRGSLISKYINFIRGER